MKTEALNRAMLMGYLRDAPEIHRTRDGKMIAKLTVATLDTWPDEVPGEETGSIEWHKVVIFNQGLARFAEQYLRKGSHVYIEGKLQTHEWKDKNGHTHYPTEVVLSGYDAKLFLVGDEGSGHEQPEENSGDGAEGSYRRFADMDEEVTF